MINLGGEEIHFTKKGSFHAGLDFKGSYKDTVYTPANGIVKEGKLECRLWKMCSNTTC